MGVFGGIRTAGLLVRCFFFFEIRHEEEVYRVVVDVSTRERDDFADL